MGADRKGPLAAFILVAIVAAVLLVTSVRSQAAPPWLDPDRIPSSVVAGPVAEPHVWGAVTKGVHQVVQGGTVLVRRAADDASDASDATDGQDTTTEAIGASPSVVSPTAAGADGNPGPPPVAVAVTHRPTPRVHHSSATPHHSRHVGSPAVQPPSTGSTTPVR